MELSTTEKRKKTSTLRGLYAIPLPIFHSDFAMRQAGTFPFRTLWMQNESVQTPFPSWSRHRSVEGLGSHREKRTMVPNEAKDFVLSQRKGLGKFQGNTWLKPLHSWSKLSIIYTLETCRYTWTKRKQSDNIVRVLHMGYNPDKTKICFKRAAPDCTRLRGIGWGWRGNP